ncbi:acyltransferase family protein [Acidovorax sp. sif0715]|uniref:acyltransferase family protein n=1 Tax=unclassified Acidovorax TaxID=2684926 RepID=UPI00351D4E5E
MTANCWHCLEGRRGGGKQFQIWPGYPWHPGHCRIDGSCSTRLSGVFAHGFVGVDLFFVISGYVITPIWYREFVQRRFSVREFYVCRINRIFRPCCWCCCFTSSPAPGVCIRPNIG